MNPYIKNSIFAVCMGLFFAITQMGYFFQLELRLTAAYPSFLAVTIAWLGGSAAGLYFGRIGAKGSVPGKGVLAFLAVSLLAYYTTIMTLQVFPYRIGLLALYFPLIAVSGAQAGHFFRVCQALFDRTSTLFFMENNGFVFGWVTGFFGFVLYGSLFNWIAPAILFVSLSILIAVSSRSAAPVSRLTH